MGLTDMLLIIAKYGSIRSSHKNPANNIKLLDRTLFYQFNIMCLQALFY